MVYDGDSVVAWPKTSQRNAMKEFFHTHGLKGSVLWEWTAIADECTQRHSSQAQ